MKEIVIGSEGMGIWGKKIIDHYLKILYPEHQIKYENSYNCHIIVRGQFPHIEKYWNKSMKPHIYYCMETRSVDKSEYEQGSISFVSRTNIPETIYTPYYLYHPLIKYPIPNKLTNENRPYLVAYCYKNKIKERERIFSLFVEKAGSHKCHALSRCKGSHKSAFRRLDITSDWQSEKLIKAYSEYTFVLAMENIKKPGYVTEKIISAYMSGAIPIYWGDKKVNDFFNNNAFINIDDFPSFEKCVDYVINLSQEKINWMRNQHFFKDNEINKTFEPNSIYSMRNAQTLKKKLSLDKIIDNVLT